MSFDIGALERVAMALAKVDLRCGDFEESVDSAGPRDLLFLDPPYTANHNFNGFLKYNERIFSWPDQVRLRDAAKRAAARGAYIVITNADHASVQQLFGDVFAYEPLVRSSVLAGKAEARRTTTEALFTANF